jgi:hypothetical protein
MHFEDGGGYNAAMDADNMPAHDDVLQQAASPSRTSRRCSFPVQPCSFLHCPVAQGQSVLNDVAHCLLTRQPFLLHLALVFTSCLSISLPLDSCWIITDGVFPGAKILRVPGCSFTG